MMGPTLSDRTHHPLWRGQEPSAGLAAHLLPNPWPERGQEPSAGLAAHLLPNPWPERH